MQLLGIALEGKARVANSSIKETFYTIKLAFFQEEKNPVHEKCS